MIKTIVCPTVEHTGSRLLASSILSHWQHQDMLQEPQHEFSLYYDHVNTGTIDRFKDLSSRFFTVVPLRHPLRCFYSWERRNETLKYFYKNWEMMISEIDPLNPFYFPVDLKLRYAKLDELSEKTGQKLETIWPYIGEFEAVLHDIKDLPIKDKASISAFVEEHKAFFGRWYDC